MKIGFLKSNDLRKPKKTQNNIILVVVVQIVDEHLLEQA